MVVLALVALLFLLGRKSDYFGEVSPRAYADWMGLDGHIDVPIGAMC